MALLERLVDVAARAEREGGEVDAGAAPVWERAFGRERNASSKSDMADFRCMSQVCGLSESNGSIFHL